MTDPTEPSGLPSRRYERLGVLGSGGQGVVYRAFDHWTGRQVAIKVLKSEAARVPHMAERLSREQQALAALKGTAAVEVLDIYRGDGDELCLVMEFLKGTTLDGHLASLEENHERMELARVAEIFDPLVDTLEVAHKAGIVHRDLKPANVFLLEDGGVRLLDFGMARLKKAAPLTAAGTVMGSPSYMAPEAWGGKSELVDHRADVYSLGVILFRVLAGDLPFTGLSLYEKMLGSTRAERPSLVAKRPDLPRDADEWVVLALAIDPDARFRNVRALWNAFLSTFDIDPPNRGKRGPSLFSKVAGTVKGLVRGDESSESGEAVPSKREPSFITEALRHSVMAVDEPLAFGEAPATSSDEATLMLDQKTLEINPPPTTLPREKPVEKTIEIGVKDFVVEDTLPDPARIEDTLPDPARVETTLPLGTRVESVPSQAKPVSVNSGKQPAKVADGKRQRKRRRGKSKKARRSRP